MKKKLRTVRAVVLMLLLATLWSQSAFAADTASASASESAALRMKFPDVPATHWAMKHITKLALEGIIQGDDKGNYNPDSSVSQQDVVIMAIRMMGLEDEALQKNAAFVLPFDASDYAKPYIAEALDKNLLSIQEETSVPAAKSAWGTRNATREWVAKMVIRALGKQDDAAKLSSTATNFKDNTDISASALGFINAAVNLHIVDGFEDGTFKPQGLVTRAQMAAFLSRSESYLTMQPSRVTIGYVDEFTPQKLTVTDMQGQANAFNLGGDIVFYTVKDDSARIPSTYIQPNMKVMVIHDKGTAYYVEDLNELRTSDETVEGTLQSIDMNQLNLTVTGDNGNQTYKISSSVTVVDQDGKGSSLGALVKGSRMDLKLQGDTVLQITLKSVPVSKTGEALLISIDTAGTKLTWVDNAAKQTEAFAYSPQLTVGYNNGTIGIDQLHPGDSVQYQVMNDIVTSMTVTKPVIAPEGTADEGKLESLDLSKRILTITNKDGKLAAYRIADNANVVIDGIPAPTLNDVVSGDDVKLSLANSAVQSITVLNRAVKAKLMSTIINYDNDLKVLTVQSTDGSVNAYKLTPSTSIVYEGTSVTLDNFGTIFGRGKKVDITASNNSVISIKMASKYDGTIVQVNPNTNELTLKLIDNNVVTFKMASAAGVSVADQTNTSISSLKPGDEVQLILTGGQDMAASVSVRKTVTYQVVAIDAANHQITVKQPAGSAVTFNVPTGVTIESQSQAGFALSDIAPDASVSISFTGNSIDKISILNVVRGKVTAVDSVSGKLTVLDYNNTSQVIAVGAGAVFTQNSKLLTGLDAVKPDDRVEVVKDTADKYFVNVAIADKRVVSSYDAYDKQIVLKRVNLDDQTNFEFIANAYIHQGTQVINPNFLLDPNEVMIYLLDGKIMELEKLS